ncbi:putative ssDNA/dsDNA binding protein VP8 [Yalta virus]|nr:putative ssDNA/dsDNA binding protein VP8 [Yalta virus]
MDQFIIEDGGNLLLNKDYNMLYSNKVQNEEIKNLFKHPLEILNNDQKEIDSIFDTLELGGAKKSTSKKVLSNNPYLKIVPSFINVVKGRIIYQGKTKLSLEKIKPTNKKDPILLGTILELSKVKSVLEKDSITKKDINMFIEKYDIIPLMYNSSDNKDKEIIFRNKKKSFFNPESKLCFVTFELKDVDSYYVEVPSKEVKIAFENIEDVIKDKKYIVSHYIYDNFFFLVPTNKIKMHTCYMINIGPEQNVFEIKESKDLKFETNKRKINLTEIDSIVAKIRTYLSSFS